MGKLTTHVLDTAHGKPGAGIRIELFMLEGGKRIPLKQAITNPDGRTDAPLLDAGEMQAGQYELVFAAGDYFAALGIALPSPRFIDRIMIAFGIAEPARNYHVPLLVSPWSYSTYRGS